MRTAVEATPVETVKHMYADQRAELMYRRSREFQIFSWSATVLVAAMGALLVVDAEANSLVTAHPLLGRLVISLVLGSMAALSAEWQLVQWRQAAAHQRVLARVAEELGCFEVRISDGQPWYPLSWREWGKAKPRQSTASFTPNKVVATRLLGAFAVAAVWWPYLL